MNKLFFLLAAAFLSSGLSAQSLQDQINAVNGAYQSQQAAEQQRAAADQRARAAAQAKADASEERARRAQSHERPMRHRQVSMRIYSFILASKTF